MTTKIYVVGMSLLVIALAWAFAAFAQGAEIEPTSQPVKVIDPICEAVVALAAKDTSAFDEAMAALLALGYQQGEILPRLRKLSGVEMTAQALIRAVLREMGGR